MAARNYGVICKPLPHQEFLRERISYDEYTGHLTWNTRPLYLFNSDRIGKGWNSKYAGKRIANARNGYSEIQLDGCNYQVHRVIIKLLTGVDPEGIIDHIDGDRSNNRLNNLRICTLQQNSFNQKKRNANATGYKGVSIVKQTGRFHACIKHNYKTIHLGTFKTASMAHEAYKQAAINLFGEYANGTK